MRFCAVALMMFLGAGPAAYAETAARILSGNEIALDDGRILRLAGIEADTPEAKTYLETNVAAHILSLQDATIDRYSRIAATVSVDGQPQSLQIALLEAGLAFVYPDLGSEPQIDAMLAAESAARAAQRGIWGTNPDTAAADADKFYGKYSFVTGTVVRAARVKNKIYLNFGPEWHRDFTIEIAAHNLRLFKKAGIDPLSWQGKKLRVRGWVKHESGPVINVTDPHQIEISP